MIVVCGEALIDFTPVLCGEARGYLPHPGGSPYNVARALGRLKIPVAFLGRISHDFFGQLLRANLLTSGVDLRYLREGAEPTTLAFVHLEAGQEPQFTFYGENTADRKLLPQHLPPAFSSEIHALHFGSLGLVFEPSASTLEALMCREQGKYLISLDPNIRPRLIPDREHYRKRFEGWIRYADIVKSSQADLFWLYPKASLGWVAEHWHTLGALLVVITLGAEGAVGFSSLGETVKVAGNPVQIVDTVGAGDAFTAGLLAWLYRAEALQRERVARLDREGIAQALAYANKVAALTCTRCGAEPPSLLEVETW